MGMGRKTPLQPGLWIPHTAAAESPGHAFYEQLNALLEEHGFDRYVEGLCEGFYAAKEKTGRASIPPGVYFRLLLVGYFEGIESERGICWRCADSLSLRAFLGVGLSGRVPERSSLSRIRKRLDIKVYDEVFRFVLGIVERHGLLRGRVVGVDSTYLRADASMKAIVRRDTGEAYQEYLKKLAQEAGIEEPTAEDCRRLDRKRKKRTSNKEWESKTDPDAKITRLKDGRTRLGYKAEHVVDLETGAIIAAPVHPADQADTATIIESLECARENVHAVVEILTELEPKDTDDDDPAPPTAPVSHEPAEEQPAVDVFGDKGYHSASVINKLEESGFRPYIPERKQSGKRHWSDKGGRKVARAVYRNRARLKSKRSRRLHRMRGERVERTFALICETGAARRTRLRGKTNMEKRYRIQAAAANLGLVLRKLIRVGTPRAFHSARARLARAGLRLFSLVCLLMAVIGRALLPGLPGIPIPALSERPDIRPRSSCRLAWRSHPGFCYSPGCYTVSTRAATSTSGHSCAVPFVRK
jgi:hypothetical protein